MTACPTRIVAASLGALVNALQASGYRLSPRNIDCIQQIYGSS
jgi:hypothetical protein